MTGRAGSPPIETDAVVIGAGPVGLFQVFELGLLGLRAALVDVLPQVGGQCIELYADKPIYDIPGTAVCTGRELVQRLQQQIAPFDTSFYLGEQVLSVRRRDDQRFDIETDTGRQLRCGVVVIAGGVGAFVPRRLAIEGLRALERRQVFYLNHELPDLAGKNVLVLGDEDVALACACRAAEAGPLAAARVTLVHRRDDFRASAALQERMRALRTSGRLNFIAGQVNGCEIRDDRLVSVQVDANDGSSPSLDIDTLLVLTGLSPRLGPISEWGLALHSKQLQVDTARFETSAPGIYAVGDVNTYPGKRKLIVCGFHEATLAAYAAADRLHPDRPPHLEYTTTSPRIHRALGIKPADAA